jgi:hypothetical protein
MLYTANHGTPLHAQLKKKGTLLPPEEFKISDSHGQFRFNHRHPHIPAGEEEQLLVKAFEQDFKINGPSLSRLIRTILKGWQRYRFHPDKRIRNRYLADVKPLRSMHAGAVWAMKRWYRHDKVLYQQLSDLLRDIYTTLGMQPRLVAPVAGRYIYWAMKKEEKRFSTSWSLEPKTFFEKNQAALAEMPNNDRIAGLLREPTIIQNLAALRQRPLPFYANDNKEKEVRPDVNF